jgi:predicted transposase YbfD/YdcC
MIKLIRRFVRRITDYRVLGRVTHPLEHILFIFVLAVLSGIKTWKDVHRFAVMNEANLRTFFIPDLDSIPGVDTIARTISRLDSVELATEFSALSVALLRRSRQRRGGRRPKGELPELVSLDGKAVKGAVGPGESASQVHIVNAVIGFITLACRRVFDKSNEITMFPVILDILNKHGLLAGKVVSIDAMGCQRDLVKLILKYKAGYILNLKGNQSRIHKDAKSLLDEGPKKYPKEIRVEEFKSDFVKGSRGREARRIRLVRVVPGLVAEWLTSHEAWEGLKTVFMIETFTKKSPEGEEETTDVRYFLTSVDLEPRDLLTLAIGHWQVETVHKILDDKGAFDEDRCKIYRDNGPENWSIFRKLGIGLLAPYWNLHQDESFGNLLSLCRHSIDFLLEILTKKPIEIDPPRSWLKRLGERVTSLMRPNLEEAAMC